MAAIDGRRSYVAGRWVEGVESFEVENPADESCFAQAGVTPIEEVRRAIAEARSSFDEGVWADRPVAERARILNVFLDHAEASREALIDTIMAEAGQPRAMAEGAQVAMGLALGYFCGPTSATPIINLVYFPLTFCSGLWVPLMFLPKALQEFAHLLPPYHLAQLALGVVGAGQQEPAWTHWEVLIGFTLICLGVARVGFQRDEGKTYG